MQPCCIINHTFVCGVYEVTSRFIVDRTINYGIVMRFLFSSLGAFRCIRLSYAVRLVCFVSSRLWGMGWGLCVGVALLLRYFRFGDVVVFELGGWH